MGEIALFRRLFICEGQVPAKGGQVFEKIIQDSLPFYPKVVF